jgi:hypothetical protein
MFDYNWRDSLGLNRLERITSGQSAKEGQNALNDLASHLVKSVPPKDEDGGINTKEMVPA